MGFLNDPERKRSSDPRSTSWRPVALVLIVLVAWWHISRVCTSSIPARPSLATEAPFTWAELTPEPTLQYKPCFDGYQCARLDVPMDYHRADGLGRRVAIAIIRLPAEVPVTDPRYGGAVLINPGGPGGSGVFQALVAGRGLQTIVDAKSNPGHNTTGTARYFDIIGFDPRGVNNTTPGFSCFPNTFAQRNWELQAEADGMLGSSRDSLMRNWQRTRALNVGCARSLSTPPKVGAEALGEHINTPPVARDMLELVERHAEWREQQGRTEQQRSDQLHGYDSAQRIIQRTRWRRGGEKLLYWGRSYGTALGATFASMFPDRIERMVLDGVVDTNKYYLDKGHNAIVDADAIFDRFTEYCDRAGPDNCPLYTPGGRDAIAAVYRRLEAELYNASVAVPASNTRGPEVVTWTDLKIVLRVSLYQPIIGFPLLAQLASDLLHRGDGSTLADFKHRARTPSCPTAECLRTGPWSAECQTPGQNELYVSSAILCTDALYMQGRDELAFAEAWAAMQRDSAMLGDYWSSIELGCAGWEVRPRWILPGPCTGNTSHPLLLVSMRLDPVTPMRSARKMSSKFPGSVVLEQDSEGHTTAAAPSLCTAGFIRHYFQTGELPPPGTTCAGDVEPMLGPAHIETSSSAEETWDALMEIGLLGRQLPL
ncbi:putative proteinase [Aspergillus candidus]|uniref:Proteinase n=1 Tax=Aspergillus candidus TaxID=41067 RepID=A0A2I2F8D1_ASPCN|nr:proteinase [Aspergillus candidus]PLB36887.1 proteinase [Aspergillus candidus]